MLAKEPDEARRTGNKVQERWALTEASRNMSMEANKTPRP
jgi:hypothetical protein